MNKNLSELSDAEIKARTPATEQPQAQIRVDGREQVLAMLKIADPEFRESLLRRLAARDEALARALRRDLANAGL